MELNIEQERREFEAWYNDPNRSDSTFGYQGTPLGIHIAFKERSYVAWLAAKRSVGGGEPVGYVNATHIPMITDGNCEIAISKSPSFTHGLDCPIYIVPTAPVPVCDPVILRVIEEMREKDTTDINVRRWAGELETSYAALYEDIYEQCCNLIQPIVDEANFPGSVVETLEILVERYASNPPTPVSTEPVQGHFEYIETICNAYVEGVEAARAGNALHNPYIDIENADQSCAFEHGHIAGKVKASASPAPISTGRNDKGSAVSYQLPELPEPEDIDYGTRWAYTADQMRDYAELAIASVKQEPLSDDQIIEIYQSIDIPTWREAIIGLARAIEQAHGIN